MFAIAVKWPGKVELVKIPEPEPEPYEVKIKTEVSTLCNATDRKLIEGHFPGINKYPLILGHESVGKVVSVGEKVRNFKKGDRIIGGLILNPPDPDYSSGWGGFSEYSLATDHRAMVEDGFNDKEHGWAEVYEIQSKVNQSIPIESAVLLCTWREVYAGLSDFNIINNNEMNNILIFGAGPVGLSFVKFLKNLGIKFIGVVDPIEAKRKMALKMGANKVFAPDETKLKNLPIYLGNKLDAVIDAVGNENIINAAISLIKMAGSICVYGVIDKPVICLNKSTGPYNFNLLIHQWPTRSREIAAQKPLVKWIKEDKINYKDFITAEFPITKIIDAIDLLKKGNDLKILLRY